MPVWGQGHNGDRGRGACVGGKEEVLRPRIRRKQPARPLTRQPAQRTRELSPRSRPLTVLAWRLPKYAPCISISPGRFSRTQGSPGATSALRRSPFDPCFFLPRSLLAQGRMQNPPPRRRSGHGGHLAKTGQREGQKVEKRAPFRVAQPARQLSLPSPDPRNLNCNFFPSVSVSPGLRLAGAALRGVERAGGLPRGCGWRCWLEPRAGEWPGRGAGGGGRRPRRGRGGGREKGREGAEEDAPITRAFRKARSTCTFLQPRGEPFTAAAAAPTASSFSSFPRAPVSESESAPSFQSPRTRRVSDRRAGHHARQTAPLGAPRGSHPAAAAAAAAAAMVSDAEGFCI
ncbi:PREDICTED: 5E5 antigen-like [Cercocebus atys]|uniref:5E5 antigen-like n=1 Tax=Cercocebus atys TaxID=9531 RepID=UPI0005F433D1|nr:PREDICTED: 5E5 antigen-like [Cercocebus atys]